MAPTMMPRISNRLALVLDWAKQKEQLAVRKGRELELRLQVVDACFDELPRGTTRVDIGGGYELKATVDPKVSIDKSALPAALARLKAKGELGERLAERLFKWSPELSLSEWKKLTDDEREIFAGVVTIAGATPALDLITP